MSHLLSKKYHPNDETLYGLLPEEIAATLYRVPSYRGKQLFKWIQRGISSYDQMLNIPKHLKEELATLYGERLMTSRILQQSTDADGTVKLLIELRDGQVIEAVLLTDDEDRRTACLSSQAGCAMGCTFCRTAGMGFRRDLTAAEIVEQFHHLSGISGRPGNIVFMGMGEPLENTRALFRAIRIFHHPEGLNIGARKMTVSTCGIAPGIRAMADSLEIPVRLAVSLNAAEDQLRSRIMPVNNAYPLAELQQAVRYYQQNGGKRITFEYVLLGGLNDSAEALEGLIALARKLDCIVNIIPWNPAAELPFREPSGKVVRKFCHALEQAGIRVTRRYRRGRGINGACGQLAADRAADALR